MTSKTSSVTKTRSATVIPNADLSVDDVVAELRRLGNESTKKTLARHGAREPFFGVRFGDMQPLRKRLQNNHEMALALYATGISDAMYLAGLIADASQMSVAILDRWVAAVDWSLLSYAVSAIAAESDAGTPCSLRWIDDPREHVAETGWMTLTSILSITPDDQLDIAKCRALLKRVLSDIHSERNRVRGAMNMFVIGLGSFVPECTDAALAAADKIGKVAVDVGDTECKIPDARAYIEKVAARGSIGKKKSSARC